LGSIEQINRCCVARAVQRADIGAERIAEIDQRRLVDHLCVGHGFAGLAHKCERAADLRRTAGDIRGPALRKLVVLALHHGHGIGDPKPGDDG
jgi:hypothetical protein